MFGPNWEESMEICYQSPRSVHGLYRIGLETHGIIGRTLKELFDHIHSSEDYTVYISLLQIYNEKIFDLLQDSIKHPLNLREDKFTGVFVQGLSEYVVTGIPDSVKLLARGERNR
jgi:hypothetical protein